MPRDRRTLSGIILVPAILVAADVASDRTALKFLMLPPFAALSYLLFVNPGKVALTVRHIVVCPVATALLAWTLANTLGYNGISVALATMGTMAIMWALRAHMVVPPLALALLTILLQRDVRGRVDYIVSVAVFTLLLYGLHRLWLHLPLDGNVRE